MGIFLKIHNFYIGYNFEAYIFDRTMMDEQNFEKSGFSGNFIAAKIIWR